MSLARTGDAYLLLEVMPGASDEVAGRLTALLPSAVQYAAAVWGPWDVIARVKTDGLENLLHFIDRLRVVSNHKIKRTETWWIRPDQPHHENPNKPDTLAFVMLRVDPGPGKVDDVLNYLLNRTPTGEGAQIWHAAGVLGPYDIATTVSYDDDAALKSLVMEHFQVENRIGITGTLTIPSISGMVYPKTHKIDINPFRGDSA